MSNSIWHKYDIKDMPDENNLVVLVDKDDGFYNAYFVDKIDWVNDWYNHIEKWCYVDDLIAQAGKVERLQKAVDLALNWLHTIATAHHPTTTYYNLDAQAAIDEIKQLIKGE